MKPKRQRQTFFRFKQFLIDQENCGMKVSTDACIFGALVRTGSAKNILDIGTGTGLLALMCAQRSPGLQITAVEIEENAARQAAENVAGSPFSAQIEVKTGDFREFVPENEAKFDLIISNPPFFDNSSKNPDEQKRMARHSDSLTSEDLAKGAADLLQAAGRFWLILPPEKMDFFTEIAGKNGLFLQEKIRLRSRADKIVHREICAFGFPPVQKLPEREISILNPDETYSPEIHEALKDYYLFL